MAWLAGIAGMAIALLWFSRRAASPADFTSIVETTGVVLTSRELPDRSGGQSRKPVFMNVSDLDFLPDGSGRSLLSLNYGTVYLLGPQFTPESYLTVPSGVSAAAIEELKKHPQPDGSEAHPSDNEGLLGLTLDPSYAENHFLYVHLVAKTLGDVEIWRLVWDANHPNPQAWKTRKLLYRASKAALRPSPTATEHNGGNLSFGPDGKLYVFFGSGEGKIFSPPKGNYLTSNFTPWGKVWRLDPSGKTPPELVAKGLRNPFSSSWLGNSLFIGDVGAGRADAEEINWLDVSSKARKVPNFGWPLVLGGNCRHEPCGGYRNPALFYDGFSVQSLAEEAFPAGGRSQNPGAMKCIILGPVLSPKSRVPELAGRLVYADALQMWVRSAVAAPDGTLSQDKLLTAYDSFITKLAESPDGFLYLVSGYGDPIRIRRYSSRWKGSVPGIALAEPAYFKPSAANETELSYDVWHPMLPEGTRATRSLVLPNPQGHQKKWLRNASSLPAGAFLLQKIFKVGQAEPEEMRVSEHNARGGWDYFHYRRKKGRWERDLKSEMTCATSCHSFLPTLGYTALQIRSLQNESLWVGELLTARPSAYQLNDLERVRHFLDGSCASCHSPGASPGDNLGLRLDWLSTEKLSTQVSGRSGRRLVIPGDPRASLLFEVLGGGGGEPYMPPPSTGLKADPAGAKLVEKWILALKP